MTVSNQTNRISADGNAAIGQEVPFSFGYTAKSDIKVRERVKTTGAETLLAETTNYTLTEPSDTGGTLTTVTAVAATSEIHIIRDTPKTQALDLEAGGSFSAEDVEDALDKNTKLIIENKDSLDRALRAPATDAVALDLELPNSVDRASKNLGFDASGNVTVTDSSGTFTTQTAAWDDVIIKNPEKDIRAYGGVGDDSTNNDAAFTNAIAAFPAGGGVLLLPRDRVSTIYKTTLPITFGNKPIYLKGSCSTQINTANASAVQIKNYGDDDAILINPTGIVGRSIVENIDVIDGHGARTTGNGIHAERGEALVANRGNLSVTLRNVRVSGHYDGFKLVRCVLSTLSQCIAVSNDNHGFHYASTTRPGSGTSISSLNCFATSNTADGYYIDGHTYCSWLNCAADGNVNGYHIVDVDDDSNPAGHSFFGCGAEVNTGVGMLFANGVGMSNMLVSGGNISSSGSDGIQTNDCFNLTIQNVKFVLNGAYGINCDNTVDGRVVLINNNYSANVTGEVKDTSNYAVRIADGTSGDITAVNLTARTSVTSEAYNVLVNENQVVCNANQVVTN